MAPELIVVTFALATLFVLASQGQPASGANANLTAQQRQQLQQLRDIIARALSTVNGSDTGSAIDREVAEVRRDWNSTELAFVHWWHTRPVFLGGIISGFVIVVLFVLMSLLCSPLCVFVRSMSRPNSEYKPLVTSSDCLPFRALSLQCAEPFGSIRYLLRYKPHGEQLIVTVRGCSGLPKNPETGLLDPYAIIRVACRNPRSRILEPIPNAPPVSSEPVRNCLDPVFNLRGTFRIPSEQLPMTVVLLEIYDWSSDNQLWMVARWTHAIQDPTEGGHQIEDLLTSDFASFEVPLSGGRRTADAGPGDICVLLERGLQNEPLKVTILECKRIYLRDPAGRVDEQTIPNVYVRVKLVDLHSGKALARRTRTVFRSRSPYFNETFSFDVTPDRLHRCGLRLSLVHVSDILRIRKTIGILELSAHEGDNSLAKGHWMALAQGQATVGGADSSSCWNLQQSRAAKCSWHCLVAPDEMARLRKARNARKQRGAAAKEAGDEAAEETR